MYVHIDEEFLLKGFQGQNGVPTILPSKFGRNSIDDCRNHARFPCTHLTFTHLHCSIILYMCIVTMKQTVFLQRKATFAMFMSTV